MKKKTYNEKEIWIKDWKKKSSKIYPTFAWPEDFITFSFSTISENVAPIFLALERKDDLSDWRLKPGFCNGKIWKRVCNDSVLVGFVKVKGSWADGGGGSSGCGGYGDSTAGCCNCFECGEDGEDFKIIWITCSCLTV